MRKTFDRRVVPPPAIDFVKECQKHVPCHLAGGAALSGAYLAHRLSGDLDLFCPNQQGVRDLTAALPDIVQITGLHARIQRDAGTLVRIELDLGNKTLAVDFVYEATPDIEPPPDPIEGVVVKSLTDLRAAKLTCLLSRSEPRDLVDLFFLDRAGFPPEDDLELALKKDAGIDPAILAWLINQFPLQPLPEMLQPLDAQTLAAFRNDLAERMRKRTLPGAEE